jgi:transposase
MRYDLSDFEWSAIEPVLPKERPGPKRALSAMTMVRLQPNDRFEDYNENHPHSGLKMRLPREVRSAQIATA